MSDGFFLPVREVMTKNPTCIDGLATIEEALATMGSKNISSLVVDRRDARDEYGLLLVVDIAREIISQNRAPARSSVYEVMTKPAPAVDADMNIKYAIRSMARLGLSHSVVLDGRELAGVVTLRDMTMRYIASAEAG